MKFIALLDIFLKNVVVVGYRLLVLRLEIGRVVKET
jgi:hypothetical protein